MKTRQQREHELQRTSPDILTRLYCKLYGVPEGVGPPVGTSLVSAILQKEYPEESSDSTGTVP